jgi:cytochrome d ubiquinol oxidase subunit I
VDSFVDVIFNPSVMLRFTHMMLSAYLCTAFAIAAICAHYLIKKQHVVFAKTCFAFALMSITFLIPIQIYLGDESGLLVLQHQPVKIAAIEGNWDTQKGAPLLLFALPDQSQETNHWQVGIPKLASLINTHHWEGELPGLKSVAPGDRPNVAIVFWSFRLMVGLGFLMLFIALIHLLLRFRGRLFDTVWFLKTCRVLAPIGFIAMISGWITTEVGRQPWIVHGLMRTADAVSPILLRNVIISLVLILIVYGIIFGVFYFLYLFKTIRSGPTAHVELQPQPFAYMDTHTLGDK